MGLHPGPDIASYCERFRVWFDATVREVLAIELLVEDRRWRYRGRLDLVAILWGDRLATLIDLKRCWAVDRPTGFQLAGYHKPAERKLRRQIGRRAALRVSPDGSPARLVEFRNDSADFAGFMNCLSLARILKPPRSKLD
jgi:hypothetical protein